jgi:hypothetical protein
MEFSDIEIFLLCFRDQYLFRFILSWATHSSFGDSRPMKNCGADRGGILKTRISSDHWIVDTLPSLALVTVRIQIR